MDIKRLIGEAKEYDKKEMLEYKKPKMDPIPEIHLVLKGAGTPYDSLTSRHIQHLIKDLDEKEIIRREGGRKLGKWIIL